MELLRPDGTTLVEKFCSATNRNRFDATLDMNGNHLIRISEKGGTAEQAYSLVVDRFAPASPAATALDPGTTIEGSVTPLGEFDIFVFEGKAGDAITLVGTDTSETDAEIHMELYGLDGVRLRTGTGNQVTFHQTLTQAGLYSVLIHDRYDLYADLTYTLDFSCSGGCPSLVLQRRFLGAASVEDINGNNVSEAVGLFKHRNTKKTWLMIKDGKSRKTLKNIMVFGEQFEPVALATIGDGNSDLISEIAVLSVNVNTGTIVLWKVDVSTKGVSKVLSFNSAYAPVGVSKYEDRNSDGVDDIGVMLTKKSTGQSLTKVIDGLIGNVLKTIWFPK